MACCVRANGGRVRDDAEIFFLQAAVKRHCVVISQNKTAGPRTQITRDEEKGSK